MSKTIFRKEEPIRPDGSLPFVIISYTMEDAYYKIKDNLNKYFPSLLFESVQLAGWTPAISELGFNPPGNKSRILSFKRKIHRDELPEIKEKCIQITNQFLKKDNSIRMTPGYQTLFNTIVASITDDFHKIYLFHGIFGEVVYKYEGRQLQYIETAPVFFKDSDVIYYFTNLRDYFNQMSQIK